MHGWCALYRKDVYSSPCMRGMSDVKESEVCQKWPLHWLVWKDEHGSLERLLSSQDKQHDLEQVDPRGRTPLHLAVTLCKVKCANILLQHNANPLAENRHRWSVLNEAVCTGNPELVGLVLRYRDLRQHQIKTRDIPLMLEQLDSAPDYYIEMKWEFGSWVPFISRMCPSDTCRIWKKGTTVRVDTTLTGFDRLTWQRGHQTLIFQATTSGHRVWDINHDDRTFWENEFKITRMDPVQTMMNQEMGVLQRMNSPVISTYLNTDTISFQRQKSGLWGFRSDKMEDIDGYKAKVFSSAGLDIVTQSRVEHLPETEKHKHKSINPIQDFLGAAQDHASNTPTIETPPKTTPNSDTIKPVLKMEQYFTKPNNMEEYDGIGRIPEVHTRVQKLKATVWLAENFPVSLQEQVMPIIDLMSLSTPHFAKIKDFISMQMPSGFPVKLEIPLFHVISAKVTFGNFNGHSIPAPHVSLSTIRKREGPISLLTPAPSFSTEVGGIKHRHGLAAAGIKKEKTNVYPPTEEFDDPNESIEVEVCNISDSCFAVPPSYRKLHRGGRGMADQEEELLQMAIQQSLLEQQQGGLSGPEGGGGGGRDVEQLSFQEVLKDESMKNNANHQSSYRPSNSNSRVRWDHTTAEEDELAVALALSREIAKDEEKERLKVEDEELEMVLRLSLQDQ